MDTMPGGSPISSGPSMSKLTSVTRLTATGREALVPARSCSTSEQSSTARPLVLRAEHVHRNLGRVGIRRNLVIEKVFRCLFDLDVACERHDDRLVDALASHTSELQSRF